LATVNRGNPFLVHFLVGHQKNQWYKRQISFEEASEIAKEHGMEYFEANAKENLNVDKIFEMYT
jgi:hypothetical protein